MLAVSQCKRTVFENSPVKQRNWVERHWNDNSTNIPFAIKILSSADNFTLPWLALLVATKGSSAISRPKTRRIPADTTVELQISKQGYYNVNN